MKRLMQNAKPKLDWEDGKDNIQALMNLYRQVLRTMIPPSANFTLGLMLATARKLLPCANMLGQEQNGLRTSQSEKCNAA